MNMNADDLLESLGVVLLEGKGKVRAPPVSKRFTEWNNFARFVPNGYVARVWADTCECCGERADVLEGVFGEELGNGGRRLTQVGRGADWPIGAKLRLERTDRKVEYCVACLEDLGFVAAIAPDHSRKVIIPA